jgi:hypothetical protein
MKKMVVMEVLWWLWRLKMKIEGGCGVSYGGGMVEKKVS